MMTQRPHARWRWHSTGCYTDVHALPQSANYPDRRLAVGWLSFWGWGGWGQASGEEEEEQEADMQEGVKDQTLPSYFVHLN